MLYIVQHRILYFYYFHVAIHDRRYFKIIFKYIQLRMKDRAELSKWQLKCTT